MNTSKALRRRFRQTDFRPKTNPNEHSPYINEGERYEGGQSYEPPIHFLGTFSIR